MNNFTKEELRCLLLTLDNVYIASRTVRQHELQEKIQSMIDNYCEHDYIEKDYICHKCNAELKPGIQEYIYEPKTCSKCRQLVFGCYQCPCEKIE